MHELYLSLGSNLGDKEQNLHKAIELIGEKVGRVVRKSSFISTEPVDFVSENNFVNAAILVETELSPMECLRETQRIERKMGRLKKSVNSIHFDRIIDIDILLYDTISITSPELTIPHPKMLEREFVMNPLNEIRK